MNSYYINEGRFLIPATWRDQSLTLFSSPPDTPAEFSVVISRDKVPPSTTSDAYARQQMAQLPASLPQFRLLRQGSAQLDNVPAVEAEFFWQSDQGRMHQFQVYVVQAGVALTFTATAPEGVFAKYLPDFQQLLLTFKFN